MYKKEKLNFEKRWESKHPLYRLEANAGAYIDYPEVPGCECKYMVTSINNAVVIVYYDRAELKKSPDIGWKVISNYRKISSYIRKANDAKGKLLKISSKIYYNEHLSKVNNKELKKIYRKYFNSFVNLLAYYNLSRPDYLLKIDEYIRRIIYSKEPDIGKRDIIFTKLTKPASNNVLTNHEIAQLKFALLILNNKKYSNKTLLKNFVERNKNLSKEFSDLLNNYSWISTQENNPAFTKDYYIKKAKELIKSGKESIKKKIFNLKNKPFVELREKNKIIKKYKFPPTFLRIMDGVTQLAELRLNVRFWWTESSWRVSNLFEELNKRIGLGNKKFGYWYYSEYLLEKEVYNLLDGKTKISEREIKERIKKSLLLMINKKMSFFKGEKAPKEENQYISKMDYSKINTIKGQIANRGLARGKVWVISPETSNQVEKANKMKENYILVAAMTRPQFIEGISKAQAIITDEGGITCHAAIISRELNIPCIVGTKIATKVLKDGDLVEVDAKKGIIRIV